MLAWGDAISTEFENSKDGTKQEQKLLLERLPALAENTWNVKNKRRNYDEFVLDYEKACNNLANILRNGSE